MLKSQGKVVCFAEFVESVSSFDSVESIPCAASPQQQQSGNLLQRIPARTSGGSIIDEVNEVTVILITKNAIAACPVDHVVSELAYSRAE